MEDKNKTKLIVKTKRKRTGTGSRIRRNEMKGTKQKLPSEKLISFL